MNVFASNNVLFDGVFCRNSDDCTTVYATRMGFHGGCRNVTMQNSTLWQMWRILFLSGCMEMWKEMK